VFDFTSLQKPIMVSPHFFPFSLTFPLPICKSQTFPDFLGEWSPCIFFFSQIRRSLHNKLKPEKTCMQNRTVTTKEGNDIQKRRSAHRECGRRRHGVMQKMRPRRLCRESTRQVQSSTELHDADRETGPALLDTSSCAAATFHRLSQSCCREEEPSRSPRHRLHPTVWPGLPDHILTSSNISK